MYSPSTLEDERNPICVLQNTHLRQALIVHTDLQQASSFDSILVFAKSDILFILGIISKCKNICMKMHS